MGICAGNGAAVGLRQGLGRVPWGTIVALALGMMAAGCTTDGSTSPTASTPRGPTVAFESIDGPPESVFHRLVQDLSEEAEVRQMAVVTREGPAQYRVRGYVAAQTQGSRSTITWVWDVYDTDQRRTLRISGEEPASSVGRGTWAVADDVVLRRIAQVGMDRLVAYLAAPDAQPGASPAGEPKPAMTVAARSDDFAPESSGIFRLAGSQSPPGDSLPAAEAPAEAETTTTAEPPSVPLPKRRPARAAAATQDSLAYLLPGR